MIGEESGMDNEARGPRFWRGEGNGHKEAALRSAKSLGVPGI